MEHIYRCARCGKETPSPGRLEGNWCPHCDARGTIELVKEGVVGQLAEAMAKRSGAGGGPGRPEGAAAPAASAAGPGVEERVEAARQRVEAEGDAALAEALRIVDEETWPVLAHIVEEEAQVSITDLYRAMGFDTKTETYRHAVKLVRRGLLRQLEEQRFIPTEIGLRAVAAVEGAGEAEEEEAA